MLEFCDVSIKSGHTLILEHLSVSFPKNRISVLIGPNGCGKTTLLQTLNGSSQVTAGTVKLDGKELFRYRPKERARKISFLPQIHSVTPSMPVRTLVEHGRFPHLGFGYSLTAKDREMVDQALEFTHTQEFASQPFHTLSGGIRQKVFFAMALVQDGDLFVLDEPTTYLDISSRREFYEMILRLKSLGKTILMVLHELPWAMRIADHMVVMDNRKIAAYGTPEECLKRHLIEEVFHVSCKRFSDQDGKNYYFFE